MARARMIALISTIATAATVTALVMPASTASATTVVTRARSNTAPAGDQNGYAWVNFYRGLAGLAPVSRSVTLESQEATHVRYLANSSLSCETDVHDELTKRSGACGANPAATAAGKAAANNSNITRVSAAVSDRVAVSNWYSSAFHALVLLDPRLATTGYAAYYTPTPKGAKPLAWKFTAGVDVYRGRTGKYTGATVVFPANNATSPLLSYAVGTESPEPFQTSTSCRSWGTRSQVSAPVIVQWALKGAGPAAGKIVDMTTGKAQSTCTLTAASYPKGSLQQQFLGGANGITKSGLYYAATPFLPGHRYQLRVRGQAVTTFVAGSPPAATKTTAKPLTKGLQVKWTAAAAGTGHVARYAVAVHAGTNCTGAVVATTNKASARTLNIGRLVSRRAYSVQITTINSANASRRGNCVAVRAR
ncbi:MAG: fibronectin type protein [Frankiales bacterium]|nr:fibronectin type protein [Frankiales bacterium]